MSETFSLSVHNYRIHIGDKVFDELNQFLHQKEQYGELSALYLLTDDNTHLHCEPVLRAKLITNVPVHSIITKGGEENKNIESCNSIWEQMLELGADRKSLLINLGGGLIGDMGGFAASTFKRGIPFIHIPTSLLGMVDATIGGKTGVNFRSIKNQIGLFHDPEQVFIYPGFLKTLDKEDIQSGFGEILKHGLISDKGGWENLKHIKITHLYDWKSLIYTSLLVKQHIVEQDPYEKGIRKLLNFGHSIGHAIESLYIEDRELVIKHGNAIAAGLLIETYISNILFERDSSLIKELKAVMRENVELPRLSETDVSKLLHYLKYDKKNTSGDFNFTLLRSVGDAEIDHIVSEELIRQGIQWYIDQGIA